MTGLPCTVTDPTPYTDDELTKAAGVAVYLEREPQPWWDDEHVLDAGQAAVWIRRLLATVDAERARADQAERSKAALVAKVKRLEDRCAVLRGALPAGDVCEGWAKATARADAAEERAETERVVSGAVIRRLHGDGLDAYPEALEWRTTYGSFAAAMTPAEADAFRRALDASPTEAPPTCDGIVPPTRHTAPMHCGRPPGHPGLHQYRPMDEDDASATEGNPE